jgi:multicomponent Na+:H+ antiporter subunit A
MALLVTGVSAVLLLVAVLILRAEYGTFQLPEILARAEPSGAIAAAGAMIAVAALAKSAQVPLHFWLPRAMAAPTPVSAYLHSAAMVAAGVFLLSRMHPLLALTPELLDGLLVVGGLSMAIGGGLALVAGDLKELLARSTISQYGYVTALLGMGSAKAAAAACLYVLVHAPAKCALFLTAGTVAEATGTRKLRELGGLWRSMPVLAAGSAAATAALAALPLTGGFFKDELFFAAALERGWPLALAAVAGAALTFAYSVRFWAGIFLGAPVAGTRPVERRMIWPVAGLGVVVVALGVVIGPAVGLAEDAGAVIVRAAVDVEAAYHLDARAENLMALGAYAAGAAIVLTARWWTGAVAAAARVGARFGPEAAYTAGLHNLNRASDAIHDLEVRDLRGRIAAILVPCGVLALLGLFVTPLGGTYRVDPIAAGDAALAIVLLASAGAAVALTRVRDHRAMVLVLSAAGFSLAVAFALVGGPDVALVAVLVETVFALLFFGVFALLPPRVLEREARLPDTPRRRRRDPLVGVAAGLLAFLVVWGALSRPTPSDGMAARHVDLVDEAHGKDVVTVILADFRGLDTLVEITVVAVALVALGFLLRPRESA